MEDGEIILGVLPGDKLLLKGGKVADVGEAAFEYFMKKADELDVSTMRNSAVFYSGRGNRELAEVFAANNGKTTLEMTAGGKWLDDMKLFDSDSPPITKPGSPSMVKIIKAICRRGIRQCHRFRKRI